MAIAKTSKPSVPTVKKKPRRRMRGALTAIGGLLIASAVLRTAVGASEAFAREDPATNLAAGASSEGDVMAANAHALATDSHPPGGGDHSTPVKRVAEADIMPLIEALNKREARIKQREADIDVRMQALSLAEQEIDRKMAELEAAEQKLRGTLALAQTAAEDDISRLTDVYANMKPKQAAALFEEMDPEFAAGFLGRMRSDAAAAIMVA